MNCKSRLTTVDAERALLAEAEETFILAALDDVTGRARVVCERYRYRARRHWPHGDNVEQTRRDIQRIAEGVASWL